MYDEIFRLDKELLHKELSEAGCTITRTDADGVPEIQILDPAQQTVADAVIAAHNRPLLSAAVLALRDLLGQSSPEWARYLALRTNVLTQKRKKVYAARTDAMLFNVLADATLEDVDGTNSRLIINTADFQAWLAARNAIKTDIDY